MSGARRDFNEHVSEEMRQRYRDQPNYDNGPPPSIPVLEREFARSQALSMERRETGRYEGLMPHTRGEWFDAIVITIIVLGVGAAIMFALAGLPPYT